MLASQILGMVVIVGSLLDGGQDQEKEAPVSYKDCYRLKYPAILQDDVQFGMVGLDAGR